MSINAPCKDCTNRHIGCHTDCKDYIETIKKYHAQEELRKKQDYIHGQLYLFRQERICACVRRSGTGRCVGQP